MKAIYKWISILVLLAIIAKAFDMAFDYVSQPPSEIRVVKLGDCQFKLEIAKDMKSQAKGLMFRESLGDDEGMLFINEAPRHVSFWMKNTYIPLDIIHANEHYKVIEIHRDRQPEDTTRMPSKSLVMYTIELHAGSVDRCHIDMGSIFEYMSE